MGHSITVVIGYGPHGLYLVKLNTTLIASNWWSSIWPSQPQSDGTQNGPHGLNMILSNIILSLQ
ncbi:hypothetical protein HAX54_029593, partial [Datura stramonium]|nr:hypothetical protein [Datura stramonium]